MNVLIATPLKENQLEDLKKILPAAHFYTDVEEEKNHEETEIIIHWTKKVGTYFEKGNFPNLKWVQVISAGINYVPLDAFSEKGIILTNTSGIHQHTITEHIIGVLLHFMRDFQTLETNQTEKHWENDGEVKQLYGKTMMIYGIGNIGRRLATVAEAFGMETIGVNHSGKTVEEAGRTVTQGESDGLIGEADIIVSILPETEETKGFFDAERFAKMKKGVLFVNVGRGSSVEDAALIEALDSGKVAFAGLDVFDPEPLPFESPLWEHEKIFITPHNSGTIEHFRDALFSVIRPNIQAYNETGKPSEKVIDYTKRY